MANIVVSACLLGVRCRYDGGSRPDADLVERLAREGHAVIPVCPEQLGGLPTPRPPAEIAAGDGRDVLAGTADVVSRDGEDVTDAHIRGAEETLRLAQLCRCTRAYLKEKSPACGVTIVQRAGRELPGMGVAAARLAGAGIELTGV